MCQIGAHHSKKRLVWWVSCQSMGELSSCPLIVTASTHDHACNARPTRSTSLVLALKPTRATQPTVAPAATLVPPPTSFNNTGTPVDWCLSFFAVCSFSVVFFLVFFFTICHSFTNGEWVQVFNLIVCSYIYFIYVLYFGQRYKTNFGKYVVFYVYRQVIEQWDCIFWYWTYFFILFDRNAVW